LKQPRKPTALLVLGEHENDREVLCQLVRALRPDTSARLEKRREPVIVTKNRDQAKLKKQANSVAAQVRRDSVRFDVKAILIHEDCDAIEPAHEALARTIERDHGTEAVPVIAATPAWETEAWLFLWPDAARLHVRGWARPGRKGKRVGLIVNAKEEYRRAVRPADGRAARPYEESDAPRIVEKAREAGLIDKPDARSDSFEQFRARLLAADL